MPIAPFPARIVIIVSTFPLALLDILRRPAGPNTASTGVMMSDIPKRRLIDQLGSSPTFVAEGCQLTGDVETGGPLVVCGAIRGDGRVGGALSMAARSQWDGEIHAQAAVIAGRISGKLVVEHKLEVGATAVIHADIIARSIAIAKGAVIDGEVTVTSGQPVVRFEEKRGPA
jgi:cytoskeletal protein CcmA (bactofilin family)